MRHGDRFVPRRCICEGSHARISVSSLTLRRHLKLAHATPLPRSGTWRAVPAPASLRCPTPRLVFLSWKHAGSNRQHPDQRGSPRSELTGGVYRHFPKTAALTELWLRSQQTAISMTIWKYIIARGIGADQPQHRWQPRQRSLEDAWLFPMSTSVAKSAGKEHLETRQYLPQHGGWH